MYKYLFIVISLFLVGCFNKECKPIERVVTKVETVEVKVPVKCKVPEVECDFSGDDFEPTKKLLQCIVEQKRALEVCRDNIESINPGNV